jgi:Low molecular weight phosphotyrosine protein phosphatase.
LYDIKEKDLSTHIPTKINEELLKTADIILVMDKSQLEFIKENFDEYFSKTFLLKEYAGFFTNPEIYDPLGQPESVYLKTVEEIKLCVEIILKNFVKNYK